MNDIELQRWLASQLPDEINYGRPYGKHVFQWEDGREIPYESWLHVASMVEAKLSPQQRRDYIVRVFNLPVSECESNIFATWQQRTRALMEVLK